MQASSPSAEEADEVPRPDRAILIHGTFVQDEGYWRTRRRGEDSADGPWAPTPRPGEVRWHVGKPEGNSRSTAATRPLPPTTRSSRCVGCGFGGLAFSDRTAWI